MLYYCVLIQFSWISEQMGKIKTGGYQIVMLSPEALFHGKWREVFVTAVYRNRVTVMAVDEAHCVVQW